MTNEEIKKAREICDKATEGPWEQHDDYWIIGTNGDFIGKAKDIDDDLAVTVRKENAEFIAFARTALPAALDEIERLQTENAKLKKALAECAGY